MLSNWYRSHFFSQFGISAFMMRFSEVDSSSLLLLLIKIISFFASMQEKEEEKGEAASKFQSPLRKEEGEGDLGLQQL